MLRIVFSHVGNIAVYLQHYPLFTFCLDNSVLILGMLSILFRVPNFAESKLCIYHEVFKFIFIPFILTFNSAANERCVTIVAFSLKSESYAVYTGHL